MRSKSTLLLLFLLFGVFLSDADAQSGYGYSYIESYQPTPSSEQKVYAESGTVLDYTFWYYYDPGVQGTLYENSGVIAASQREISRTSNGVSVFTEVAARPDKTYKLHADHYVGAYWGYNSSGGARYLDYFGLNNFAGIYSPPYSFLRGPSAYYYYRVYKVATTNVSIHIDKPPLRLSSIDLTGGAPGNSYATLLRGSGLFGSGQSVQVSGNGVTATVRSGQIPNTIEALDIDIQIASDADIGDHNITLTVDGRTSNAVTFRVGDRSPQITNITPPEGSSGEQVVVIISGTGFGLNPIVQIDGFGVSQNIISASTTEIQAVFSVADSTYTGTRNVNVVSRGISGNGFTQIPGNSNTSNTVGFEVVATQVSISDVVSVEVGGLKTVNVTITGAKSSEVTVISLAVPSGSDQRAKFQDGSIAIYVTGNVTNAPVTIKGFIPSNQINDFSIRAFPNAPTRGGSSYAIKRFTVVGVEFSQENNCTGYDDTVTPDPYLMVPQNGSNKFKAKIIPAGAVGNFRFEALEQNSVTASASPLTNGEQLVTVTAGANIGTFTLQALATNATAAASILKIAVRKKIEKNIVIFAVTEDNDDVQEIPVGNGQANRIAIEPSGLTLATSVLGGDDTITSMRNSKRRVTRVVTTGANGIRETAVAETDIEIIPMNQGAANSFCVKSGTNLMRDTNKNPSNNDDDVATDAQGIEYIHSGANGICQTEANDDDILPVASSIPSVQSLQDYLNNTTWAKQANVFFSVTRDNTPYQVNFDLDRDRVFNSGRPIRATEYGAISDEVGDGADIRLFYTGLNFANNFANAETVPGDLGGAEGVIFFSPNHNGTVNYLAAHELGHTLMTDVNATTVHSPEQLDLMYYLDSANSPCRIRKRDWDLIDRSNP